VPKERSTWRQLTKVRGREIRDQYSKKEIKIHGSKKEKIIENIIGRKSRVSRFGRRRRRGPGRRLCHALLKSTNKTTEWEEKPVECTRGRRYQVRSSTSARPRFRVIFIRLARSFLACSGQSGSVNGSCLRGRHRYWRTILRLLRAAGAAVGGPCKGPICVHSGLFIVGRTATCLA